MMHIQRIKQRGVLFTYEDPAACDLNLYLIRGEKYNYIIDTGLGSLTTDPIRESIKNDHKPMIVINTHYHWDHIWGNGSFQDCLIVSHQLCRELIRSRWDEMLAQNSHRCRGTVALNLPNLVFTGELYFAADQIRLFHAPGHTADSISVLDETEKVLIVADNVGENMPEIIPSLDCGRDIYRSTIQKYAALDFDTCISGHNAILGKAVLETILSRL